MSKKLNPSNILLIVILIFALSLSACGSEKDDNSSGGLEGASGANSTATPRPTLNTTVVADADANADTLTVAEDNAVSLAPITLDNTAQLETLHIMRSPSGFVGQIILSEDEHHLFNFTTTGVEIWSMDSYELIRTVQTANETVWEIAVSPDGNHLVTIGDGGLLELWDVNSGESVEFVVSTGQQPTSVQFTPDGEFLTIGYVGGITELRHFATNEVVMQFAWQRGVQWVASTEFSLDGSYLLTAHPAGNFILWDTVTGERIQRFIGHASNVSYATFNPANNLIASTGQDNTVRIWDVESREELRQMQLFYDGNRLAFNTTGNVLASTGQSGRLRLWHVGTGDELRSIDGDITDGTVWTTGVTFNNASDLLIYGYNGVINIMGVPVE